VAGGGGVQEVVVPRLGELVVGEERRGEDRDRLLPVRPALPVPSSSADA
jgi:hypothetical protein